MLRDFDRSFHFYKLNIFSQFDIFFQLITSLLNFHEFLLKNLLNCAAFIIFLLLHMYWSNFINVYYRISKHFIHKSSFKCFICENGGRVFDTNKQASVH